MSREEVIREAEREFDLIYPPEKESVMPFPKTEEELKAAGYLFKNDGRCKGCEAMIEWWETPNGKNIPLDKETLAPHWGTCPKRDQFRK